MITIIAFTFTTLIFGFATYNGGYDKGYDKGYEEASKKIKENLNRRNRIG